MTAPQLRFVPTPRALPVKWDGRRVAWDGWRIVRTSAEYHAPPECCGHCGSSEARPTSAGTVYPLSGETSVSQREKRSRSGRTYTVAVDVPAWPGLGLMAFRCPDCLTDEVLEIQSGTCWVLDESDYGPDGSVAP